MLKMLTFQLSDENINIILTFVMLFSPDFCVLQEYAKVLQIQVNSNVVNPQICMFQTEVGKVTLKSNGDEALNDEFL
jgi:hypothetical protein